MSNPPPKSELKAALAALWPVFRRVAALSFLTGLLSLTPSFYMLEVYDRVVNSRSMGTLAMLTLLAVGVYAMLEVLEWVRGQALRHAGMKLETTLGDRVFDALFRASMQRGQGGSQQALADLRTVREFFASPAVLATVESPVVLVILAILFAIHPLLGWAAVLGALVQVAIAWLTQRRTGPPLAAANTASNAAQAYAGNSLRNAQVIESMGMLAGVHERWAKRQYEFLTQQAKASDHAGGLSAAAKSTQLILTSALLGLGCWLILEGLLIDNGGLMILGLILGGRVMQPIVQLVSNWRSVEEARGAWSRLDELLRKQPPPPERMSLPAPTGLLAVEGVTAGAPGSPLAILRNVSFVLPAGECLAVVGPSASGKTTLMRLVMGLWPALAGKVRLDGADVFAWDKNELGPYVGYLPQDVELFDGTLAENIARFGEVDRAAVDAAGRLVGLDALAAELPEGYDSRIGDEGAFLSGGQRQRVGLARAIYGAPRFVVLDEPNSSLDESGEALLLQLLRHLKAQGTTVVIVTHRPNVLTVVDKMLLLINGVAQAYGPRDEVLAALAKAREAQAGQPPAARSAPAAPVSVSTA